MAGEPKDSTGKYLLSQSATVSRHAAFSGIMDKVKLAHQKGALAVFVVYPDQPTLSADLLHRADRGRTVLKTATPTNPPVPINFAAITHATARQLLGKRFDTWLKRSQAGERFDADPPFVVRKKVTFIYQKQSQTLTSTNVVGYIEGTEKKDEYIVLTAHYDHLGKRDNQIYYGADDDGSGVVAILEMAQAFAQAKAEGNGPLRTVVCMMVSGEEKGLLGSAFYADNALFPLDKTMANLNIDMIGRIDEEHANQKDYLYLIGEDKISSDLQPLSDSLNTKYTQLKLDRRFNDPNDPNRFYYRSDHYNFAKKGVPIIFYFNGVHPDYHQPTDTVNKIDYAALEKRSRLIFYTAWEMANRPAPIQRDIPLK